MDRNFDQADETWRRRAIEVGHVHDGVNLVEVGRVVYGPDADLTEDEQANL